MNTANLAENAAVPLDLDEAATVQELLQDLAKVRDFPSLSQVIARVNQIAQSEHSRNDELTEAILKDVSLTNKLLRIVNSAHFGQFGSSGAINTISRAIVILGFDTVRDVALSLMLFEHLANHAQAKELKGEAVESFFCGLIGRALAAQSGMRDGEEVFICALFRNLGRLMCRLHFYERSQEVERLVKTEGLEEETASRRVFGLSYDEFGLALGRLWHLPASLMQGMHPLPPGPVKAPGNELARLQVLSSLAHDLYVSTRSVTLEKMPAAIAEVSQRYGQAVNLHPESLLQLMYDASAVMEREARILEVDVHASPLLKRLLKTDVPAAQAGEAEVPGALPETEASQTDSTSILITGMQDLTSMMLGQFKPSDLLHVAAELLYRSSCFDRVLICSIDSAGRELIGRIAFGRQSDALKRAARIPLTVSGDVFYAATGKHVDILIADTQAENIRSRIPKWYADKVGARSFILLPVTLGNRTVALIYGDRRDTSLQLPPQTLNLVKALRNQVALALRQHSAVH